MTSTAKQLVATIIAIVVFTGSLTSCGEFKPPRDAGEIALVVGGRANMPRPQLVSKAREYFKESVLSRDHLVVVGVSGKPEVQLDMQLESKCNSDSGCEGTVSDYEDMLSNDVFNALRAKTPEADTLGAILLAAEVQHQSSKTGPKRIVVIDNALQTSGDLRLQAPGALAADAGKVIEQLGGNSGKLKPLAGTEVLLTGLGSVAAPQPELSLDEQNQLKGLWTKVLSATGAKVVPDLTTFTNTPPLDNLPTVTPVLPPKRIDDPKGVGCARFREDQVGFLPDKSVFADAKRVQDVLAPIAETLREKKIAVTVTGTTALPEDAPFTLSTQRAQAVVKELTNQGVPGSLLQAGGVGTNFAGYVPPYDATGQFIETLAVQNRLVIIAPVGQPCP
ncbi:OmpA family protein [Kutzneria chonburiensis]|uniref:OmpA family protein n=1 Tax=Kutzneria chonburiensis TaxID=1483604 RepID=A0ABV6MPW8_9PSEU|nr:OmpA family protein [Kutzneria chonburiensis]